MTDSASPEIVFKTKLDGRVLAEAGPSSRLRPLGLKPVGEPDERAPSADRGPLGGDVFAQGLADLSERDVTRRPISRRSRRSRTTSSTR